MSMFRRPSSIRPLSRRNSGVVAPSAWPAGVIEKEPAPRRTARRVVLGLLLAAGALAVLVALTWDGKATKAGAGGPDACLFHDDGRLAGCGVEADLRARYGADSSLYVVPRCCTR
jgi:hypothetical protein